MQQFAHGVKVTMLNELTMTLAAQIGIFILKVFCSFQKLGPILYRFISVKYFKPLFL